jgi:hypothetical protein
MSKKKEPQYFKVISDRGHHGVIYQLGLNVDPIARPLKEVNSCGPGAIYFTTAEFISEFSGYGNKIAWVTPKSAVKKDECGDKWKAHKIEITKILPVKEALALIPGMKPEDYGRFGIDLTNKFVMEHPRWSNVEKFQWLYEGTRENSGVANFLIKHKADKSLLKFAKKQYINWDAKDVVKLVNAGLTEILHDDDVRELCYAGHVKALKKFAADNPKKFFSLLPKMV